MSPASAASEDRLLTEMENAMLAHQRAMGLALPAGFQRAAG